MLVYNANHITEISQVSKWTYRNSVAYNYSNMRLD